MSIAVFIAIIVLAIYFINGFGVNVVEDFESCVAAGNPVMESYPRQCRHDGVTYVEVIDIDLDKYFRDELYEQAVENNDGRIPIEGFDPSLYKGAYPRFIDSDFDEVDAVGGKWMFVYGKLEWISENPAGPVTSADGTLTPEGLDELLDNLEERFGISVNSKKDIDDIIEMLSVHKCRDDERSVFACIAHYDPVCGWNDPDKIQCIRYPCTSTYSNGCEACKNEEVSHWTPGECPLG